MQLCLKISLVIQLECILLFVIVFIHSADLNFIHYAGELGGGTDIIPGEFEGVHFYFILIYRRSSYLARINWSPSFHWRTKCSSECIYYCCWVRMWSWTSWYSYVTKRSMCLFPRLKWGFFIKSYSSYYSYKLWTKCYI